jgi:hypothetical protein
MPAAITRRHGSWIASDAAPCAHLRHVPNLPDGARYAVEADQLLVRYLGGRRD